MAFDHGRDKGLRAIEASHLFAVNTTRLAVRRGAYLRTYAYEFIQQFAPELTRKAIEQALIGPEAA
jgi:LysR family cys regulon transcriptional activator